MRVSSRRIGLTKKQVCFLDKLISRARYSTGKKFTRSQVVSALFSATKKLDIDVTGLKNENELSMEILAACRKKHS